MRSIDAIENPDFFVPGEEFYVTSDSDERIGDVIIDELLRPASKRTVEGFAFAEVLSIDDASVLEYHTFENTSTDQSQGIIHITSRWVESLSPSFEEMECIQELMRKSGVSGRRHVFTENELTLEAIVRSEPHFFSESHYRTMPQGGSLYSYVQFGYRVGEHDVYIHPEDDQEIKTTLSSREQGIFSLSVEMMNFTISPVQIAEITRALRAIELVTDDEVRRFVEKLP